MSEPAGGDVLAALARIARSCARASALALESSAATADPARRDVTVDLCRALCEMKLEPALRAGPAEWAAADPVHVAVFGGTNTGKSTVLNVLLGRAACGMKVTARFSQHPEAWAEPEQHARWRAFPGRFAGYAMHAGEAAPRQPDAELAAGAWRPALAVRELASAALVAAAGACADGAVFWDAPDVSTEEAQAWLRAVIDTLALADLALFVATNESYADDRGLELLALFAASGAEVDVVANKVAAGSELYGDVRAKVAERAETATVFALPWVEGAEPLERLARLVATPEAGALRAALAARAAPAPARKLASLARALEFLDQNLARALEPLQREARVAERWAEIVAETTERELVRAYAADYLETRRYQEFKAALAELVRLIEIPGIGRVFGSIGRVARVPVALLKRAWGNLAGDGALGERPGESEQKVVARLFAAWLAALKAEAQGMARNDGYPAWSRLAAELDAGAFQAELVQTFEGAYRGYRAELDARVRAAAAALYEAIAANPRLLASLRAANLVGDASVTISAVAAGGLAPTDLLLGPLVHGLWEELVERGLGGYIGRQEELLKTDQLERVRALFEAELAAPARARFSPALDRAELDGLSSDLELVRRAGRPALEPAPR